MFDPSPPDRLDFALCRATWVLTGLGYGAADAALIIEHCREYGSAAGCESLADRHFAAIEQLLPTSPAWDSPMWDAERFAVVETPSMEA